MAVKVVSEGPDGIGCNFTRGGDGTVGWLPSDETREKWSMQRRGNKNGSGPRPASRGKSKPWVTNALKGKKRPDLSAIAQGKKRGNYDTSDEMRWKQGATNRGKKLSEEHRKKIGEASKGRVVSEETRQKMRKPRTPEQRERYRLAAIERWKKKHENHHEIIAEISQDVTPSRESISTR